MSWSSLPDLHALREQREREALSQLQQRQQALARYQQQADELDQERARLSAARTSQLEVQQALLSQGDLSVTKLREAQQALERLSHADCKVLVWRARVGAQLLTCKIQVREAQDHYRQRLSQRMRADLLLDERRNEQLREAAQRDERRTDEHVTQRMAAGRGRPLPAPGPA